VQTIIGIEPHIMVIGIPQLIVFVIMSQHILSMSMLIMPVGIMAQLMPFGVISQLIMGFMGMPQQLIMGIPEHIIMQGVPFFIIAIMVSHMSFIMSMDVPSTGIIMHFMPCSVMEQVMWQDIGIIMATGIGMLGIIPGVDIMGICMGETAFMGDSLGERDITKRAGIITDSSQ